MMARWPDRTLSDGLFNFITFLAAVQALTVLARNHKNIFYPLAKRRNSSGHDL